MYEPKGSGVENLINRIRDRVDLLDNKRIRTYFTENLEFHELLSSHLEQCSKNINYDIINHIKNNVEVKSYRINIESNRLKNNINDLQELIIENNSILKKANIILDIFSACPRGIEEGFKGGHFKIRDGGELYLKLEKTGLAEERISSHYGMYKENGAVSGKSDRSLAAGKMFNEFIFGIANEPSATWFQLEPAPLSQAKFIETRVQKTLHSTIDTLNRMTSLGPLAFKFNALKTGLKWIDGIVGNSKLNDVNQYGISNHTEKSNPLTIVNKLKIEIPEAKFNKKVSRISL